MTGQTTRLTYYGHACFKIDNGHWSLVLDPYKPEMIGYPPLQVEAHVMLASHEHEDHNYMPAVKLLSAHENPLKKVPAALAWPAADPEFFLVKALETYHDDSKGKKRGNNKIHIIRTNGLTIAHLGDLGHPLSQEQAERIGQLDLLLLPVGGYYTIDAQQAVATIRQLAPRNVVPMHYQIGYGKLPIATVNPFLELIAADYPIRMLEGPELLLTRQDQQNCFVPTYQKPG